MDQDRFVALWSRCCGQRDAADSLFRELEARYGEPHRRYHTGAHIEHCLRQFDLADDVIEAADAVELALWFHDLRYDPAASDNEQASAEIFRESAVGLMDESLIDQVYRLIMATIHNSPPQLLDEQYVVDIDLSSFGLPWEEFYRDSCNVRDEFPALSEKEFAQKNGGFLQSLLDRPSIYSTEFFRDRLEPTARKNVRKQIALLRRALD